MTVTAQVIGPQRVRGDEKDVPVPISSRLVGDGRGVVLDPQTGPAGPGMTTVLAGERRGQAQPHRLAGELLQVDDRVGPAPVGEDACGVEVLRKDTMDSAS